MILSHFQNWFLGCENFCEAEDEKLYTIEEGITLAEEDRLVYLP
jgi:hypothetical protein